MNGYTELYTKREMLDQVRKLNGWEENREPILSRLIEEAGKKSMCILSVQDMGLLPWNCISNYFNNENDVKIANSGFKNR